jgi:hypothetical protein
MKLARALALIAEVLEQAPSLPLPHKGEGNSSKLCVQRHTVNAPESS